MRARDYGHTTDTNTDMVLATTDNGRPPYRGIHVRSQDGHTTDTSTDNQLDHGGAFGASTRGSRFARRLPRGGNAGVED